MALHTVHLHLSWDHRWFPRSNRQAFAPKREVILYPPAQSPDHLWTPSLLCKPFALHAPLPHGHQDGRCWEAWPWERSPKPAWKGRHRSVWQAPASLATLGRSMQGPPTWHTTVSPHLPPSSLPPFLLTVAHWHFQCSCASHKWESILGLNHWIVQCLSKASLNSSFSLSLNYLFTLYNINASL